MCAPPPAAYSDASSSLLATTDTERALPRCRRRRHFHLRSVALHRGFLRC